MVFLKLRFRARLNELSPLALFMTNSFVKNQSDFEVFSPKYDDTYAARVEAKRKEVDKIINPIQLTGELKVITRNIYSAQTTVSKTIGLLQGYAKRAVGLSIDPKDFGFGAVRISNNSGDIEGLGFAITVT